MKIHIFFGEMGAGKTFLASRFAKDNNCYFLEGDSVCTQAIMERASRFESLTRQMVIDFVYDALCPAIIWRATTMIETKDNRDLVVAQALYFDHDRYYIKQMLETCGFEVVMHWVKVSWWRNIKQLWSRPRGMMWIYYWLINHFHFQKPSRVIE